MKTLSRFLSIVDLLIPVHSTLSGSGSSERRLKRWFGLGRQPG